MSIDITRYNHFPIHLHDRQYLEEHPHADLLNRIIGGIESAALRLYRRFQSERSSQEYTFETALHEHIDLLRSYDRDVAAAGGATLPQRLETLGAVRTAYVNQEHQFLQRYPESAPGCELEAIDTVLASFSEPVYI